MENVTEFNFYPCLISKDLIKKRLTFFNVIFKRLNTQVLRKLFEQFNVNGVVTFTIINKTDITSLIQLRN